MFRVTSLTEMPDAQLNRWIKRIGLLLLVGVVAFIAFYAVDRFRAPAASIADREIAQLEEAVRTNPTDLAARGQLADTYFAVGRNDDAIALYTQIIDTGKEQRPALYGRARVYETKGDLAAAKADYQKVVDLSIGAEMAAVDAVLARTYYGLASIALQEGTPQEAVDLLTKSLAIRRTDADSLSLLGLAYVRAGTPDKAIEPLQAAILFVPVGWADPYTSLAEAYGALGQPEMAESAAAMAQAQSGDPGGATKRLEAIADGPAALDARISLGLVAEQAGDSAPAAEWYGRALELDPQNKAATMGLSRVTTGTQSHPSIAPASLAPEGSN
jgi:tetratricopeptide (TPR) repeat protein